MKTTTRLTILCLSISLGATGKEFKTLPISDEVAKTYKLDNEFYTKGTLVQDILIATSSRVSDFAHAEAAYLFNMMLIGSTRMLLSASGNESPVPAYWT